MTRILHSSTQYPPAHSISSYQYPPVHSSTQHFSSTKQYTTLHNTRLHICAQQQYTKCKTAVHNSQYTAVPPTSTQPLTGTNLYELVNGTNSYQYPPVHSTQQDTAVVQRYTTVSTQHYRAVQNSSAQQYTRTVALQYRTQLLQQFRTWYATVVPTTVPGYTTATPGTWYTSRAQRV